MRVLIAAGGTAGHLFPALGLITSLEKSCNTCEIAVFLTQRQKRHAQLFSPAHTLIFLDVRSVQLTFDLQPLVSVVKLLFGFLKALFFCIRYRPDVAVGFGSYASLPVMAAAIIQRVPTVVHEQNVAAGRANRFLARFVDRVLVSFPETERYFKNKGISVELVGNPLRPDLRAVIREQALKYFGLPSDRFTLGIMGGSQGAHVINAAVVDMLTTLPKPVSKRIQVVHLTGAGDHTYVSLMYQRSGVFGRVSEFLEDMGYFYGCCDVVIARAGAMTVTELAAMRKAAILIPYPHAYGHQQENAAALQKNDACIMITEPQLDKDRLWDAVVYFFEQRSRIAQMGERLAQSYRPAAADALARAAMGATSDVSDDEPSSSL
jgi:UDP-N-acetylglucosamine--N-acetylmuramyl-(pentapeptide) pyrophosphoryl-undecaprenol N-acetylglucosamine transferase